MMRIAKTHSYTGPNRWSKEPVAEYSIEFDTDDSSAASELSSLIADLHQLSGVEAASFSPQAVIGSHFSLPLRI